ncbi:MAG: hypothetical protein J6Q51_04270 [Clostridia bacterium]|nr:hypothetical protein [Clostridia bacterium]
METKHQPKNHIFLIIIGFGLAILLTIIGALIPINKFDKNNPGIIITKEFTATSNVTNILLQEYKTSITGTIKNTTKYNLEELTIIINVKTNVLNQSNKLEYKIKNVPPYKETTISFSVNTNGNFETVEKVSAYTNDVNKQFEINSSQTLLGTAYSFVIVALIAVSIIFIFVDKKQKENQLITEQNEIRNLEKTVQKERLKAELKQITQDDAEIHELEQEVKREKLKAELKQITKSEIYCKYCGYKNNSDNQKCLNCGASLNNNN